MPGKRGTTAQFSTKYGKMHLGKCEEVLRQNLSRIRGKVNLIMTSPPFPLNNKKKYGNLTGDTYRDWFVSLAPLFSEMLAPDGSIIIELGNSWEKKRPVQSLLHLESLLGFVRNETADLRLCQQFVCYNPSRLPSPAAWVTINRIRTVDSFTHVWWMAKTDFPKADNRNILRPYSKSMEALLQRGTYNAGKRPSQHHISEGSFLRKNPGSIMPNVIELEAIKEEQELRLPRNLMSMSNTNSNDFFMKACREEGITPHPARMQYELVDFFIQFLTDEKDIVLDPFAGSNTTGFCAERLGRRWYAIEAEEEYVEQAKLRFQDPALRKPRRKAAGGQQ